MKLYNIIHHPAAAHFFFFPCTTPTTNKVKKEEKKTKIINIILGLSRVTQFKSGQPRWTKQQPK